ncbi:hypothetical protein [Leifsonia sp. TF02-11]|nr:hypothetical protein [Leifsonia sp. TF02-11]MBO1738799.1 hypothetical protein [Leifsonia sp. TF02-11]
MSERDPRVDAYLNGLPLWQQQVLGELRDILHEADPAMEETIKRSGRR